MTNNVDSSIRIHLFVLRMRPKPDGEYLFLYEIYRINLEGQFQWQ
jgi:hypothetical protein